MASGVRAFRICSSFGLRNIHVIRNKKVPALSMSYNCAPVRGFSVYSTKKLQKNTEMKRSFDKGHPPPLTSVTESTDGIFYLRFEDDSQGAAPLLWLRDNCQCPYCFDSTALARSFVMEDLNVDIQPKKVEFDESFLSVTWTDEHISTFDTKWLYQRAFNPQFKATYEQFQRLPKKPWNKNFQIQNFNYNDLLTKDKDLLRWLVTMEEEGASLVQNVPNDSDAGGRLSDHVGFVRKTHYGRTSAVYNRSEVNNLAFRSIKLGLHVDLPYYDYQPGVILLHMMQQHNIKGGDSTFSDGFFCGEYLRQHHPKEFEMLTKQKVHFWDRGFATTETETDFYKTGKHPVIRLDNEGKIVEIRFNNQVRDSFIDIDIKDVNAFYKAIKLFYDILNEQAVKYKMKDGEILILDNQRCLHGREAFETSSNRHLETSYIDWDEMMCRRRRLMVDNGYDIGSQ